MFNFSFGGGGGFPFEEMGKSNKRKSISTSTFLGHPNSSNRVEQRMYVIEQIPSGSFEWRPYPPAFEALC